jgi:single-strand DNA-binding protein
MPVNKVFLLGNLTRTPELRFTPSGLAICQIGIAVNRVWYDQKTNEKREEVTFVDVDVFGKQAETANTYLVKGRQVHIEGRLKLDQWDDKQTGQKRQKLKVVCERLTFVGNKGDGGQGQTQARQPAAQQAARQNTVQSNVDWPPQEEPLDIPEENVPF